MNKSRNMILQHNEGIAHRAFKQYGDCDVSVWLDTNPVVIEMTRKNGSCVMNFEFFKNFIFITGEAGQYILGFDFPPTPEYVITQDMTKLAKQIQASSKQVYDYNDNIAAAVIEDLLDDLVDPEWTEMVTAYNQLLRSAKKAISSDELISYLDEDDSWEKFFPANIYGAKLYNAGKVLSETAAKALVALLIASDTLVARKIKAEAEIADAIQIIRQAADCGVLEYAGDKDHVYVACDNGVSESFWERRTVEETARAAMLDGVLPCITEAIKEKEALKRAEKKVYNNVPDSVESKVLQVE